MKYFTLNELTRSDTASRMKIDNTPTAEAVKNLTALVDKVLDPLREKIGEPIIVTSGYRCPRLNKAVGGVSNSQHITGQAADISFKDKSRNKILFDTIIKMNLPFDQLIDEYGLKWIHCSYSPRNRRQIIYKK